MEQQLDTVTVDGRIAELAGRQHSVVGVLQMLALGLSHGTIAHRVRKGWLHRVHRGVYAVGHPNLSGKGRYMAAVLACGPEAVLSHASAADLWDLRGSSANSTHVTVPSAAGRSRRKGIVVHRACTLHPSEVTNHAGIPITTVASTLLDLAAMTSPASLGRTVQRSVILRLFDLVAIKATLARHPNRKGAHALSAIVADLGNEPQLTRSELEVLFRDLCAAHSVPQPRINEAVDGYTVDFLWRDHMLIVETDGREAHGTPLAFERDRARDATLVLAGYRVVRFTYRQVACEPEKVARTVLALLAAPLPA